MGSDWDPGHLLRTARRRAALTQRELARRAGTSQSVVARIEQGQTYRAFEKSPQKRVEVEFSIVDRSGAVVVGMEHLEGEATAIELSDAGDLPKEPSFIILEKSGKIAARGAFKEAYARSKPVILEPIMKLSVEGPAELQGGILRTIMQRRGMVIGTTEEDGFTRVDANVPLAEMFGYASDLRSATQGKAEFTLEFERYAPAPREVSEDLIKEARARREAGK